MTKEDIFMSVLYDAYSALSDLERYNGGDNGRVARNSIKEIENKIDKFFEQNVVIPKGENRHPYADVLHEWVEGADMQFKHKEANLWWNEYFRNPIDKIEYRIKPKEPVYEWQWYKIVNQNVVLWDDGHNDYHSRYASEEEINSSTSQWIKFEETKRERK